MTQASSTRSFLTKKRTSCFLRQTVSGMRSNALKNAVSGDVTKVTAATALLHFTEKGGILQEFDDDLFNEYVNRIIVRSRNEVRFELKCGLALRERM